MFTYVLFTIILTLFSLVQTISIVDFFNTGTSTGVLVCQDPSRVVYFPDYFCEVMTVTDVPKHCSYTIDDGIIGEGESAVIEIEALLKFHDHNGWLLGSITIYYIDEEGVERALCAITLNSIDYPYDPTQWGGAAFCHAQGPHHAYVINYAPSNGEALATCTNLVGLEEILDKFVTFKLKVDPITGITTASVITETQVYTQQLSFLPGAQYYKFTKIIFDANGWWTGHDVCFDYLSMTITPTSEGSIPDEDENNNMSCENPLFNGYECNSLDCENTECPCFPLSIGDTAVMDISSIENQDGSISVKGEVDLYEPMNITGFGLKNPTDVTGKILNFENYKAYVKGDCSRLVFEKLFSSITELEGQPGIVTEKSPTQIKMSGKVTFCVRILKQTLLMNVYYEDCVSDYISIVTELEDGPIVDTHITITDGDYPSLHPVTRSKYDEYKHMILIEGTEVSQDFLVHHRIELITDPTQNILKDVSFTYTEDSRVCSSNNGFFPEIELRCRKFAMELDLVDGVCSIENEEMMNLMFIVDCSNECLDHGREIQSTMNVYMQDVCDDLDIRRTILIFPVCDNHIINNNCEGVIDEKEKITYGLEFYYHGAYAHITVTQDIIELIEMDEFYIENLNNEEQKIWLMKNGELTTSGNLFQFVYDPVSHQFSLKLYFDVDFGIPYYWAQSSGEDYSKSVDLVLKSEYVFDMSAGRRSDEEMIPNVQRLMSDPISLENVRYRDTSVDETANDDDDDEEAVVAVFYVVGGLFIVFVCGLMTALLGCFCLCAICGSVVVSSISGAAFLGGCYSGSKAKIKIPGGGNYEKEMEK